MTAPPESPNPDNAPPALVISDLFSRCGEKATTRLGGPMHVQHPDRDGFSLCGLRWWFECNHGSAYCERCQRILRSIYRRENTSGMAISAEGEL